MHAPWGSPARRAKDAVDWLPDRNQCWFAARVVAVKRNYALTVDAREASAREAVLRGCTSTRLVVYAPAATTSSSSAQSETSASAVDALALYDDNRNGKRTCKEARAHRSRRCHAGIQHIPT